MTTSNVHDDVWPDFLTVEQAAAIVRIGRTVAYELARRYLSSGGVEGLPVLRVGKQLRVPRVALERWLGGPLSPPRPTPRRHQPQRVEHPAAEQPLPLSGARRPRRFAQSSLFEA